MSHLRTAAFALALGIGLLASRAGRAASFDLTGDWTYAITEITVQGACPSTGDFSGAAVIAQAGGAFTLDLVSGQPCLPAGICSLAGTAAGAQYEATSGDIVADDEGGIARTDASFTASSATAAAGTAVSTYTLDAFQCIWTSLAAESQSSSPASATSV